MPVQVSTLGDQVAAVSAGDYHRCALKSDGTLWCWGGNEQGELGNGTTSLFEPDPIQVDALGNHVTEVAVGNSYTCARQAESLLWCWGDNYYGQLGDGTTQAYSSPAAAGFGMCP